MLNHFGRAEGTEKSDQQLTAAHEREIGLAGDIIGAIAEDLHNNVSSGEYRGAIRQDLSAFFYVSCIGIAGLVAGAGFDDDLHARFGEHRDDGGNQRNAALSGITFFGDSNNHAIFLFGLGEPN